MNNNVIVSKDEMNLLLANCLVEGDSYFDILIVSEDTGVVEYLKNTLTHPCFNIHTRSDPIKALTLCKNIGFNLILVDYKLTGMNGVLFFSLIKDYQKYTHRFLISESVDPMILIGAINDSEINAFIRKPIANNNICYFIAKAVAGDYILKSA